MIQRRQSVFLFIAVVLGVVAMCMPIAHLNMEGATMGRMYSLMLFDMAGKAHYSNWPLFAILLPSTALSFYTIFIYKHRPLQARLCALNALLVVTWYIALAVYAHRLAPAPIEFQISYVAIFPAIAVVLLMMARSAILADERLVKAADRIR